jgi:hypothetical protein
MSSASTTAESGEVISERAGACVCRNNVVVVWRPLER